MKNLFAAALLLVSFAVSSPTDTTDTNCQKTQNAAVANLAVGIPAFVSAVVFIPVPIVSYVIFGFYLASATKISMEYSNRGCGVEKASKVAAR